MSRMTGRTTGSIGRALAGLLALTATLALSPLLYAAQEARAADESDTDLVKKTQNPVANLISVPFQSNFNFNTDRPKDTANWQLRFQLQFLFPK